MPEPMSALASIVVDTREPEQSSGTARTDQAPHLPRQPKTSGFLRMAGAIKGCALIAVPLIKVAAQYEVTVKATLKKLWSRQASLDLHSDNFGFISVSYQGSKGRATSVGLQSCGGNCSTEVKAVAKAIILAQPSSAAPMALSLPPAPHDNGLR